MDKIWRNDLVPQYEALKGEIFSAMERVLESGRYILATEVAEFEKEFAAHTGTAFAVGVGNGFDALVLSLRALGVGPGDEVITTPFTAIPTYSAIRAVGADAVFVDVEPDTYLIDLTKVKEKIGPKTKAIVPVHLFGNPVDIEKLREIVGALPILEDCAQAHGAEVRGRRVGSMGTLGAFSFFPSKNLGAYGDGGMVVTASAELAEKIRLMRMYGMINKDEIVLDGYNSRLDELQAAILRLKLKHLDRFNADRETLARRYERPLRELGFVPQAVRPGTKSVHHVYCPALAKGRDELVAYLEERGIQTNIYYPLPVHHQKAYRARYSTIPSLPVAEALCAKVIALPFYPELKDSHFERVMKEVTQWATRKR